MIQLPKIKLKDSGKTCKCFPFCKNKRREWKGKTQKTSAELLLDRKPAPDCRRRYPRSIGSNACPLFARKGQVHVQPVGYRRPQEIVRICTAPVDSNTNTTYLDYMELTKRIGAWKAVCHKSCPFCFCGRCCNCNPHADYKMRDAERRGLRRSDMQQFDARVVRDRERDSMRIMYQGSWLEQNYEKDWRPF